MVESNGATAAAEQRENLTAILNDSGNVWELQAAVDGDVLTPEEAAEIKLGTRRKKISRFAAIKQAIANCLPF